MSSEFPPRPDHPDEIEMMLEGLASVIESRTAYYVSSPLTTGQVAYEWHLRNGALPSPAGDAEFRRVVMEPNRERAADYVRELRHSTSAAVIDPTAMGDLAGWAQSDYRSFWGKVIERYAETVVFRNGWQYSSGCAYEFLIACGAGARVLREDLAPLTIREGLALLRAAINECEARGDAPTFLEAVAGALEERMSTVSE
jgi:hypothetical protein